MDKNAIKKFAVWARRELIERVSQKAMQYGIEKDNIIDAAADSINGTVLTDVQKNQRRALISQINHKGFEEVMEEVAYTWFNRFIALRFMEVNGYLPTRVRVFTDEENNFKPQIIDEALHLDLDGLDMDRVYELKNANQTEELYKYLLITQCNALNSILPGMFQRISDYTELLLPDNLLREGSVIEQMISLIPEEDWQDAVQIIGWLYQYYNAEKKDEVFAALKKNVKITKENIPAATQLFTPDWIVRYMVENSLGRLWVEGHPNDELKTSWKYYLEEAEQEPEVQAQLAEIRKEYAAMTPEQLKCIDPCCGSGHILAYLFDVLVQIYESYGYTTREAVESIVKNNLYGLDIDDRAAQLAYFAVMMKARQYDRRFFSRQIQPNVYAIRESNDVDKYALEYFCKGDAKLKGAMDSIINEMQDAKEYGSILNITPVDFAALYARFDEVRDDISMSKESVLNDLLPLVQAAQLMSQKYDAVITNPPYMGSRGMSAKLNAFVQKKYPDSKSDMFAVFIEKCRGYTRKDGFYAMITQPSFLFLTVFEALRKNLIATQTISSLLHMGRGIFGIDFGSTAFSLRNTHVRDYVGTYLKLHQRTFQYISPEDIAKLFLNAKDNHEFKYDFSSYNPSDEVELNESTLCDEDEVEVTSADKEQRLYYTICQKLFLMIPGTPISYWLSDSFISAFQAEKLGDCAEVITGMTTGKNSEFLRLWYEVARNKTAIGYLNMSDIDFSICKWIPYSKGGDRRNFYGNGDYVVNWTRKDEFNRSKTTLQHLYLKPAVTWPFISSGKFSARYLPQGYLWDVAGSPCFFKNAKERTYALGFLCTKIADAALKIMNPTINVQAIDLAKLPFIYSEDNVEEVCKIVNESVTIATAEWDDYEVSWDFAKHPLIRSVSTVADAFAQWEAESNDRFAQLKANEEELNRIFIDIYGLQKDLTPEVGDKDVTVRKADLQRDIKSLISYAVGCMFGRYSLDVGGLAYAGGDWDESKYTTYPADKDNIIPICDDEYFDDDMVGRFVKFIETVYGSDTLEENLKFIADALGGKGQPREVIRNYFLNDFYADHCKIYQKRPIYWLFDSGKKNGFKALIYMHRYQPDTIARIRTDYVHEQQSRYRTAIADMENRIANASTSERVKLNKVLNHLKDQDTELRTYEEKIHHLADQMIAIDLDDGVKVNYAKFQDVLAKIK